MTASVRVHDLFASLLTYPGHGYVALAEECRDALEASQSDAAPHMVRFVDEVGGLTTDELEELFTTTFDLNPVCSLEVGWHLHGDTYDRGEFLWRMRQMLRRCGVAESSELPDHMAHVVPALARLDPGEARALLAGAVFPAMAKMQGALASSRSPFGHLLNAVSSVLGADPSPGARAAGAGADADGRASVP
jgi:nitrate reductase delta subunit